MTTATLEVGDLFSVLGAHGIEKQLQGVAGVNGVSVNPIFGSTTVSYDPSGTSLSAIRAAIQACGFHCAGESLPEHVCATETAATMGVKIKMVTGDALAIAREMAKTLGMGTNTSTGRCWGDSKTQETPKIARAIEDADGFAQVFPEHRFHIADELQEHDHVVGMTGDGVNDAPALKKDDCGFAVSGATDAAHAAARQSLRVSRRSRSPRPRPP